MNKDKCVTKGCRNDYAMNYLGKKICNDCWEKICDNEVI